ncbi:MAG: methyltransferase domain-containing protein [Bacillota bacterium]
MSRQRSAVIRRRYDRIAPIYDLMDMGSERRMGAWRKALWDGARGRILEVGVGTGKNMPYYPSGARVTAIDFSPRMLERAERRARRLGASVDLIQMDAQNLAFPDNSFDTVVTACVFCSVPDPVRGLREIRRVLRPDGNLLMLEHMRSELPLVGPAMDLLNPLVVGVVGANINRRTLDNIRAAGLQITSVEDLLLDIFRRIVAVPAK